MHVDLCVCTCVRIYVRIEGLKFIKKSNKKIFFKKQDKISVRKLKRKNIGSRDSGLNIRLF